MAALALKAVDWGAEKIPDKAFHSVPGGYFRPPEIDEKKRRKREKQRWEEEELQMIRDKLKNRSKQEQNQPSSESQSLNGEETVDSKPRRKERPRRGRDSSYIDRGYESDRGPQGDSYFQSPPREPDTVANVYPEFKPYNPADYAGPPTQEERDRAHRPSRTQFDDPATPEHPVNTVAAAKESNAGPENLPRPENDAFQPPPFDPAFPHEPTQLGHSVTSPPYPISPMTSPKARKLSTSLSSNPASSNSDAEARGRKQSTAQAKYTPINYTPEFYAPSPPPAVSERLEHQLPSRAYRLPSPARRLQTFVPASDVAQPYAASGPFILQPRGSESIVPQPNNAQQPMYPAYGTAIAPHQTPADPEYPPYDRHPSPRYFSPPPNCTGYYSPSESPQSPNPRTSKDRDRDRNRSGNRNRDRNRSSRLREALKEHKDVGTSALGALAGGLLGNKLGHGRPMGTMLGATVGGIGANFAEEMWKEEQKLKQKKRRDDRHYEGQRYKDGYDSY